VGKSTVGRAVAARLGVPYLDTGAMYRAVGLAVKREGIALPLEDAEAVVTVASRVDVRVTGSAADARTWLNTEDVSREIRTPEISAYASAVSAVPGVRRRLAGMQRRLALEGGGVLEGRDIGTVVVPETPHKFFLTASAEVRARRRFVELSARGSPQSLAEVLSEMVARDRADSTRADSPLTDDGTYTRIDTSALSVEAVVERVLSAVGGPSAPPG
jgi:cytidylate kinase